MVKVKINKKSANISNIDNNKKPDKLSIKDILSIISGKDEDARSELVSNPNCPVELLEYLSDDTSYHVRCEVAKSPNCPTHILMKLAKDKEYYVRKYVAKNPNCSIEILDILATDKDSDVLSAVVSNKNIKIEVASKIINENSDKIYSSDLKTYEIRIKKLNEDELIKLLNKEIEYLSVDIFKYGNKTEKVYDALCKSSSRLVKSMLAEYPSCPPNVLFKLVKENYNDTELILSIIENKNCPVELFEKLIDDQRVEIRKKVIINFRVSTNLISRRLYSSDKEEADLVIRELSIRCDEIKDGKLIDKLSKLANSFTKFRLINNPACETKTILYLLNDNDTSVKSSAISKLCSIASGQDTSIKDFELLCKCEIPKVRRLVANNPSCPIYVLEYMKKNHLILFINSAAKKRIKESGKTDWMDKFKEIDKAGLSEEEREENLKELDKLRSLDEEKRKQEELRAKKIHSYLEVASKHRSEINKNIEAAQELADEQELEEINRKFKVIKEKRIRIPEEELIIVVGDHKEIRSEYLQYIDYIDFSFINTDNLKVCGIDWSRTNIRINPQTVYKKDLSYSKWNDDNIMWKSFEGCNLIGCDISGEYESVTGLEAAIIDDTTKTYTRNS